MEGSEADGTRKGRREAEALNSYYVWFNGFEQNTEANQGMSSRLSVVVVENSVARNSTYALPGNAPARWSGRAGPRLSACDSDSPF